MNFSNDKDYYQSKAKSQSQRSDVIHRNYITNGNSRSWDKYLNSIELQ